MAETKTIPFEKRNTMKLVSIVGNLAVGKSSLLTEFVAKNAGGDDLKLIPIFENLDRFTSYGNDDCNPLALTYADPLHNCVANQFYIMDCLVTDFCSAIEQSPFVEEDDAVVLTDRSLYSPIPFTNALYAEGYMSTFSMRYLVRQTLDRADETLQKHNLEYNAAFFLHAPVELCLSRIRTRGRPYEQNITIGYLSKLEESLTMMGGWWENWVGPNNFEIHESASLSDLCISLRRLIDRCG